MSAAVAAEQAPGLAPARSGKKKILLIGIVVLVLALLGGGGAVFWLKSKAAHAADDGEEEAPAAAKPAAAKVDVAHPPTFLPLDVFVVNLADRDAERYAQIGLTLEVDNAAFAEQMKTYMPAIRNSILMILAHKTSRELLERSGKEQLAAEIMRETVRPLGISIPVPKKVVKKEGDDEEGGEAPRKAKAPHNPVRHVHFSNFIIQ